MQDFLSLEAEPVLTFSETYRKYRYGDTGRHNPGPYDKPILTPDAIFQPKWQVRKAIDEKVGQSSIRPTDKLPSARSSLWKSPLQDCDSKRGSPLWKSPLHYCDSKRGSPLGKSPLQDCDSKRGSPLRKNLLQDCDSKRGSCNRRIQNGFRRFEDSPYRKFSLLDPETQPRMSNGRGIDDLLGFEDSHFRQQRDVSGNRDLVGKYLSPIEKEWHFHGCGHGLNSGSPSRDEDSVNNYLPSIYKAGSHTPLNDSHVSNCDFSSSMQERRRPCSFCGFGHDIDGENSQHRRTPVQIKCEEKSKHRKRRLKLGYRRTLRKSPPNDPALRITRLFPKVRKPRFRSHSGDFRARHVRCPIASFSYHSESACSHSSQFNDYTHRDSCMNKNI